MAPTTLSETPSFCVDGWEVDPSLLRLRKGDDVRQLEPKILGVLCVLARHSGEVVTRADLFDEVWEGTVVTDDVLTRSVSQLRKLFGDTARDQRVIETIPKVGYRLAVPVTPVEARETGPERPSPMGTRSPSGQRRRLGVPLAVALALVAGAFAADALAGRDALADGGVVEAHPLTTLVGHEMGPRLSPDGKRVVYGRHGAEGAVLEVRSVHQDDALELTDRSRLALNPTWSPDGRSIAFVHADNDRCDVAVVEAVGGPIATLAACPGVESGCNPLSCPSLDWSPDGRALMIDVENGDRSRSLAVLDVTSGDLTPIEYPHEDSDRDRRPRVSPDGRRVLFLRTRENGPEALIVLDMASRSIRPLADIEGRLSGADWLDDETVLVTTSDQEAHALWRVAVPSFTKLVPVRTPPDPVRLALTHVGGRIDVAAGRIVMEVWSEDGGVYTLSAGQTDAQLVPTSSQSDLFPSRSPDGARLAFLSDRSGRYQVWTSEDTGSRARRLTDLPGVVRNQPVWSPSGRRLAFAADVGGQADIHIVDEGTAAVRRLALPSSNEGRPRWSPDGRWLYVRSDRGGEHDVWKVSADGGTVVRVTTDGSALGVPSLDGRWLYTMQSLSDGLWRRPLSGEGPGQLVHPSRYLSPLAVDVGEDGVYVVDYDQEGGVAIVRVSERGSEPVVVGLDVQHGVFGLDVEPDGEIMLGRLDLYESDVFIADL